VARYPRPSGGVIPSVCEVGLTRRIFIQSPYLKYYANRPCHANSSLALTLSFGYNENNGE